MSFDIKWTYKSRKFLKKLPAEKSKRIVKKIGQIRKNPFRYLEHYEGNSCYKLRVGSYRALIDVDFKKEILVVRIIDKRGRIYKR